MTRAADPRAGDPIQFRVFHGRRDVADRENVGILEIHIDVSAGVRIEQIAVFDLFAAGLHGSLLKNVWVGHAAFGRAFS